MTWLAEVPFAAQLTLVLLLLVVDAGFLVGVFVPSGALLAALAAQVVDRPALLALTIATASAASVTGTCLGYWRARGRDPASGWLTRVVRGRTTRMAQWAGDRMSRCPSVATALGQCFAGARTLTPRLAARAGISLPRVLAGSAPAAVVWACVITSGGVVLAAATAVIQSIASAYGA